ncbi:MAG: phosphatidylglycerophosphatase A [Bryobacterales bacterium]
MNAPTLSKTPPPSTDTRTRLATLLATWGGIGYAPIAPGTAGSLAALLMGVLAVWAGLPVWSLAIAAAALFFPACWAAGIVECCVAATDPSEVVVDEVVGQWLALAAIDPTNWLHWAVAFAAFRAFDALKPFGIRRLERLPDGYGVLADDAAAGLCAMIVVAGLRGLTTG